MNCGFELQTPDIAILEDWLSFIGLGRKEVEEKGTPPTVGLEQDATSTGTAILVACKKLTCTTPFASGCGSPSSGKERPKKNLQADSYGNSKNCRTSSGMCVDCGNCQECCVCDDNTVELLQKAANNTYSEHIPPHQMFARTKDGMNAGNSSCTSIEKFVPQHQFQYQSGGNSLRYNMGDEGEYLRLTHRTLKEHSHRSKTTDSRSYHSYASYNSSNTGSSRRRYNFGVEDDLDYNYNQKSTTRRGHHCTASDGSTIRSSRKSNTSFSLRLGKKNKSCNDSQQLKWSSSNAMDDAIIGKTFSFDSNPSRGSAFGSVHSSNHTGGSRTTKGRANSQGGSSLSSSSRSYLEDGIVIETDSKKSWFRRRFESRE
mmetsp:Transcript_3028/g.8235  ORF Transcript_3028/g.8235 Transcript_3028/m.8235 type:complete len:371 (+) Transcript_3028:38-1150(+)